MKMVVQLEKLIAFRMFSGFIALLHRFKFCRLNFFKTYANNSRSYISKIVCQSIGLPVSRNNSLHLFLCIKLDLMITSQLGTANHIDFCKKIMRTKIMSIGCDNRVLHEQRNLSKKHSCRFV